MNEIRLPALPEAVASSGGGLTATLISAAVKELAHLPPSKRWPCVCGHPFSTSSVHRHRCRSGFLWKFRIGAGSALHARASFSGSPKHG